MKNMNQDYLIQKYAEASEKVNNAGGDRYYKNYWQGIKDAYHSLLSEWFEGWANNGSVGYYVFVEGMDYNKAVFYNRTGLTVNATA